MFTKPIRFVATLIVIASIAGNTGIARADRGAAPVPTVSPASSLGVQFVHVATAANIYASYTTVIDNPLTNGNPNAIIIVTPDDTPGNSGGTNDPHPIGVIYSSGNWAIFNQDSAAIPVGAAFNVIIPTAGAGVFVQNTTAAGTSTDIDSPLTDGHPNANILVTPNYNPGGVCPCVSADFHIGVEYHGTKWAIFTQDGSLMPLNAAFNVFVLPVNAGVFVQKATVANTANVYSTSIDNSLTNGNPNALIFVTPDYNPGGGLSGTSDDHPSGVFYNGSKWEIYHQDLVAMPVGAAFNVLVLVPSSNIFVTRAMGNSPSDDSTTIDNALTNGHANAIAFVTSSLNPGGGNGVYNNHNIGVFYNTTTSQWEIFNQDALAMPNGSAFNVLVPHPDASVFVHTASAANVLSHSTVIDYPLTNGNPNAILLVTPNIDPGGIYGVGDDHPIGVFYDGSNWRIFNQDGAAMPVGAAFNVFVPPPGAGVLVHTVTTGNTSFFDTTEIDNPLTNGHPNAIVVATPNWNPGGVGGTNDSHPIGVYFDGIKWAILNLDGGGMPLGAAFNVYVFSPPTILSVVRANTSPTGAASVNFTLTFSEAVTGVDVNDFSFTNTGVTGASVTNVSGGPTTYTVNVNTGSGSGTLRLDVPASATITDLATNPLAGLPYTAGESYSIDKTVPTVASIVRANPDPTAAASITFTVSFSKAVTGVDGADFSFTNTGVTGTSVTNVSGGPAAYTVTVNSGSGDGTIRLDVPASATITDLAGNALVGLPYTGGQFYTINKTLTFTSSGAQDGWVLESSELSNKGGTINSKAPTFNLGDNATKKQYRGILSFSTGAALPDTAVITGVTLRLRKSSIVGGGNPVTLFKGFMVDIKNGLFGTAALQPGDFQAAASQTVGPFKPLPVSNWYSINLSGAGANINKLGTGLTQIRLRFVLDDNNNTVANYLSLFSGNAPAAANRPRLIITYYVP
jgi:hypothetical protein